MTTRATLLALARVVAEESEKNALFRHALEQILNSQKIDKRSINKSINNEESIRRGRRQPAFLDPVDLAKNFSSGELLSRLGELTIEQLKDVVAQYGMDPSKLVMKWKDKERIIERIVEVSVARSTKGDAFR